jgi:hypothetical protein
LASHDRLLPIPELNHWSEQDRIQDLKRKFIGFIRTLIQHSNHIPHLEWFPSSFQIPPSFSTDNQKSQHQIQQRYSRLEIIK